MLDRSGGHTPTLPVLSLTLHQHIAPHSIGVRSDIRTDSFVRMQVITGARSRARGLVRLEQLVYCERARKRHRGDLKRCPDQLAQTASAVDVDAGLA